MNQSINQSTYWSINQSIDQSFNQSINRPIVIIFYYKFKKEEKNVRKKTVKQSQINDCNIATHRCGIPLNAAQGIVTTMSRFNPLNAGFWRVPELHVSTEHGRLYVFLRRMRQRERPPADEVLRAVSRAEAPVVVQSHLAVHGAGPLAGRRGTTDVPRRGDRQVRPSGEFFLRLNLMRFFSNFDRCLNVDCKPVKVKWNGQWQGDVPRFMVIIRFHNFWKQPFPQRTWKPASRGETAVVILQNSGIVRL